MASMQLNKASKKTRKSAVENPAPATTASSSETTGKSRAARSSQSASESVESGSVKHHHKAASSSALEELKPLSAAAATEAPTQPVVATAVALVALESAAEPSNDEIALQAHALWMERGCEHGFAEQDWLRAEQRLKAAKAGV